MTGDFNLDLLKHESHSITAHFNESLFAFGFLPMITKPTRITAHSMTLIDNTTFKIGSMWHHWDGPSMAN